MAAPGLDVAAGTAGLISLSITLFHGCVQAFDLFNAALRFGRDADIVRSMLEWELYRLYQWSERIGLEDTSNKLNPRLNWNIVADLLGQLESLLTSTAKLKERYNLNLVEMHGEPNAPEQASTEFVASEQSIMEKFLRRLKPSFYLANSRILHARSTAILRLRWAAWDKERVTKLVKDVAYFNDCLYSLLEIADQEYVRLALSTLLRDMVSESSAASELEVIKHPVDSAYVSSSRAIAAALSIKQIRLIVGFDRKPDEQDATIRTIDSQQEIKPKLVKLRFSQLRRFLPSGVPRSTREIAKYKSFEVLVEWKYVDKSCDTQLRPRVEELALLLSSAGDASFHSLECLGFLKDDTSSHYAYVFKIPSLGPNNEPLSGPATSWSLAELLQQRRKPTLNERFELALALCETVLQLHTAGWLHKGIRSDNVLIFDMGQRSWDSAQAIGPFLMGYGYSRADRPHETTETSPSNPGLDLYCHPNAQGSTRLTFRKHFDLYALGCVLLEIGLWSPLPTILSHDGKSQSHFRQEMDEVIQSNGDHPALVRVAFSAGTTFLEIVVLCLTAGLLEKKSDIDKAKSSSIEVQRCIVEKLKTCKC